MAKIKVTGEQPFQVGASRFCVGASESGYVLNYSADGVHFTPWNEGTPIDTDLVVTEAAEGMFFFLEGNESEVVVTW